MVERNSMNNLEEEWNVLEQTDSLSLRNPVVRKNVNKDENKISDDNDVKTDFPFLHQDIMNFRILKISVLDYNIEKNRSKLKKDAIIYISHDSYHINAEEPTKYNEKINFGREGDIQFEELDKKISKKQFQIRFINQSPSIVCLCPPPKMPTSFKINEIPYFLEKDHIISFGKQLDLIFRVNHEDKHVISFQQISFIGSVELNPQIFTFKKKRESIFGSTSPLNSPEIEAFNVNLGFANLNDKRWFFRRSLGSRTDKYAYLWVFKFDQLKNINPLIFETIESRQVSLKSGVILNIGNCDLKISSVE